MPLQARLLFVNAMQHYPVNSANALDQANEVLRSVLIVPEEQAIETQVWYRKDVFHYLLSAIYCANQPHAQQDICMEQVLNHF